MEAHSKGVMLWVYLRLFVNLNTKIPLKTSHISYVNDMVPSESCDYIFILPFSFECNVNIDQVEVFTGQSVAYLLDCPLSLSFPN